MDSHHLTPSPGTDARWSATSTGQAIRIGRAWLRSPALRDLCAALGGPRLTDPDRDLPSLARWSSAVLDTRRGSERHSAPPAGFTLFQVTALLGAAGPLGLLSTPPPGRAGYDITVILGGTVTGNELRSRLARDLSSAGTSLGTIVALTTDRPLTAAEGPQTGYQTESEHLTATLSSLLAASPVTQPSAGQAPARRARGEIRTMIARSSRPGARADTSDAIREFTRRVPGAERQQVLVVTSAIYVPYQFFAIIPPLLGNGSGYAELVGTPTATDGQPTVLAQRIGQEIHAAISTLACQLIPRPGAEPG